MVEFNWIDICGMNKAERQEFFTEIDNDELFHLSEYIRERMKKHKYQLDFGTLTDTRRNTHSGMYQAMKDVLREIDHIIGD